MKKLFVILPLVLIMILSSVSVFAVEGVKVLQVASDAPCQLDLCASCDFGKIVDLSKLNNSVAAYPVWFATYQDEFAKYVEAWCGTCGGAGVTITRQGDLIFLDTVPTVVYANRSAATPTMIVEQALADAGLAETFKIPSLKINNIYNVTVTIEIPQTWAKCYGVKLATPEAGKTVEVALNGYIAVVEAIFTKVSVTHHIQREGEPEVQIEEVKDTAWLKEDLLKPERVPAEWAITYIKDVTYRPELTTVAKAMAGNVLIDGEQHQVGWKVDMFYTNAKDGKGTDAAKANTNANTAAAASNLPSTGVASNLYIVLASAAAIVLGVFLKK